LVTPSVWEKLAKPLDVEDRNRYLRLAALWAGVGGVSLLPAFVLSRIPEHNTPKV